MSIDVRINVRLTHKCLFCILSKPDHLQLRSKCFLLPLRYMSQYITHKVNFTALPGSSGEALLDRGNKAFIRIIEYLVIATISFICSHTKVCLCKYKGLIRRWLSKTRTVALKVRNGGFQKPDWWLNGARNLQAAKRQPLYLPEYRLFTVYAGFVKDTSIFQNNAGLFSEFRVEIKLFFDLDDDIWAIMASQERNILIVCKSF